jgi:K+-transporting ATPase ATPase A chain
VGIAAAVAVIRGVSRKEAKGIGNFWGDLVRCNLYVLLPISLVYAVFLMSQGVIQNFSPYIELNTLEGAKQIIAQGPVASQVAIKMLGTNGGGFFNANAAHPYENPTAVSNLIQMLSIFLIPSGLVYLLGSRVGNLRHGWAVWIAMLLLFMGGTLFCAHFEYQGNPVYAQLGCSSSANWEGKEARFGIFNSALFAGITTDASCGAVNSMHDSFTPLGGLIPLVNILLGEIVFGGVGSGLYGMLMYIILTVFIAGLMVGRTPEYLGKKIEGREVKYVMLAMIVAALSILGFTAWGALDSLGLSGLGNPAGHGFSEILYAYASVAGNNGSSFAGLSTNTTFWNLTLAFAMFFGRFFMMIPMLAVAGSLAHKKIHPGGEGSFPVDGAVFVGLLIGVILLVGALTYFPALSLGPIAEHFDMMQGHFFK